MNRLILLLLFLSFQVQANQAEPLPRVYGYVIGDVLDQKISLDIDTTAIELKELPILQRVGPWVQRLSAQTVLDEQGSSWLSMRYQIINAPLEPKEVALPALSLPTKSNGLFEVASQPFSLSPITLDRKPDDNTLPFMLPDRVPVLADGHVAQKRLNHTLIALGSLALLWLAWWLLLKQRDKTVLPFSKAMHRLRSIRRRDRSSVNENREAWSAVHEAFNAVANQTLSSRTAQSHLRNRRWLEPFSAEIASFYKASDQRFFEPNASQVSFDLYSFCKALYRAEKQNTAELGPVP